MLEERLIKLNRADLNDLLPNDFLARKELWDVITNLVSVTKILLYTNRPFPSCFEPHYKSELGCPNELYFFGYLFEEIILC